MHYNQNGDKLIAGRIFDIMINWKLVLRKHYLIMIIWKIPTFPRKDYWFSFYKSLRCSWVIGKRNFRPWMLCFSISLNLFFSGLLQMPFLSEDQRKMCMHTRRKGDIEIFEYSFKYLKGERFFKCDILNIWIFILIQIFKRWALF